MPMTIGTASAPVDTARTERTGFSGYGFFQPVT